MWKDKHDFCWNNYLWSRLLVCDITTIFQLFSALLQVWRCIQTDGPAFKWLVGQTDGGCEDQFHLVQPCTQLIHQCDHACWAKPHRGPVAFSRGSVSEGVSQHCCCVGLCSHGVPGKKLQNLWSGNKTNYHHQKDTEHWTPHPQLLFLLLSLLQLFHQLYTIGQQGLMGYWTRPCSWLEVSHPHVYKHTDKMISSNTISKQVQSLLSIIVETCTCMYTHSAMCQCKQDHSDLAERLK